MMNVQGLACVIAQYATEGDMVWLLETVITLKPIIWDHRVECIRWRRQTWINMRKKRKKYRRFERSRKF